MQKKPKVKIIVNPDGSFSFTLPFVKTRKGTKAKPSVQHQDKRKKKQKYKHKEYEG